MKNHYEVVVVGGGISGAAVFYELARYTDICSIALLEKYQDISCLNSNGTCNSQTVHCGDIETNYTFEKAKKVRATARMVVKYGLQHGYENKFMFAHQKMAIGVGDVEVEVIKQRFEKFREIYPYLQLFDKQKLKKIEPNVVLNHNKNGDRPENIVGMGVENGEYTTVDFGKMAQSLIKHANEENKVTDVIFNSCVSQIDHTNDTFYITTKDGRNFSANYVIVDAGAHSLFLAHKMGYGLDYSCLPIAGSFYLTKKRILNGKVYMVQNPKLPFAALHGDPDILANGCTRFGPTALVMPKLERYHGNASFWEFIKTLRVDRSVMKVFVDLFGDSDIRNYVMKNFGFEIPYLNKYLFVKDARKIVPSLNVGDVYYAHGFGGVRPQVIDKTQQKLLLGEASINTGTGITFNMTPSPGATSCLGSALKDTKEACKFLGKNFNEDKFNTELLD